VTIGCRHRGRDAIVDFYRPFRRAVDETVDIKFLMIDDKHVAVEMATEFHAREDYANFTRGPLQAGDTVRITSFVHYDIGPDGRFAAIRIGRFGDLPRPGTVRDCIGMIDCLEHPGWRSGRLASHEPPERPRVSPGGRTLARNHGGFSPAEDFSCT